MIFTPTMQPHKSHTPWQHRPTNDNVQLVATISDNERHIRSRYTDEICAYEDSRDFRKINSLMRERSAVRL